MDKETWVGGVGVFASCYIKRWLEGHYDTLMDLPAVAKLRAASPGTKYAIEAILYALTAYAEQRLSDRSPLGLVVKAVLMDAAPEISSRLLKDAREDLSGAATIDVATAAAHQLPPPPVIAKLLALEDTALLGILTSLEEMDDVAREKFKNFAADASADELKRFGTLPPDKRMSLLSLQPATGGGGKGGGGWWGAFKSFAGDFWHVFKAWSAKTYDFSLSVLMRYLAALLWVLKVSAVLWGVALVACTTAAISGRWTLFGVLIGLLFGCGGLVLAGRALQQSWLTVAGIIGSAVMATLAFLAGANYADSVFAVAIFFLVGMPTLAIVAMLLPITSSAEIFRKLFPEGYRTLVRAFQMLASAFCGLLFFSVLLLLFPPHNPVAFLFIVPAVTALALGVGVGVVRINPEVFLRTPVILGLMAVFVVTLGVMSMPNLRSKISLMTKTIDLRMVDDPRPVTFTSSRDIDFVATKDGEVRIWYAETRGGGYELFRCEGVGPYYAKDGRALRKADSDAIREKISTWVDQTTAEQTRVQQQKEAKQLAQQRADQERSAAQQKAEQERLAIEAEARRVQAEKDRLASYIAVASVPTKLDFVVCAQTSDRAELTEFSSAWVEQLKKRGKTATDSIFSAAFVKTGAMETCMRGQGGTDVKALQLSAIGDKLLFAKCESATHELSTTIADLHSSAVKMSFAVVNAVDGRLVESFQLSATGPGFSEGNAKSAAFGRIIDQLDKRGY
ncbi:MAG: hypothetical protein A3K19_03315 [Lentisphaerae bacterium RIFOXYB12_FULL_65_16]|nr:MAG: hypothetical protein A3K18_33110 [Lentisphaerae bacterium RIFOXYA12_64_32]OGV92205.1 MAG: hypothetical protein A3K19_03315 [Lentisphaerae bacterium RIFOXYB12_FULL_65_16]